MSKKILTCSFLLALLMSGCATKQNKLDTYSLDDVDFQGVRKADMSTFEMNLLRVATKAEKHWKDYYSLLEKRKNLYDEKLQLHVPSGMGKNVDLQFEGYCGDLLKKIAEIGGYDIEFKDMNPKSTPVTAIKYERTSLWDVLQLTMAKIPEYGVDINESEKTIKIYPKY